jgi:hypothetical protein
VSCDHGACYRIHGWHHARRDGHAVICDHCNHVHLGAAACHNSERRDHLCGCKGTAETGKVNICDKETTMATKTNGKDQDGFENVDGNAPAEKKAKLTTAGLRVSSCNVVEDAGDGSAKAEATIIGVAHGMTRLVGSTIQIETMDGVRRFSAQCRSVTISEAKTEGLRTVKIKASGGRELDALVGRQVKVSKSQQELPLNVRDEVEAEEGAAPVGDPYGQPRRARGKGGKKRGAVTEARA